MILKLLLIVALIGAVYYFFIKKKPIKDGDKKEPRTDDMVECAKCGTYVSLDEAIISNARYYCSNECVKEA